MREYLQLYLNENKEIENMIQHIKKAKKKYSSLNNDEFTKKINDELFNQNILCFDTMTKNMFEIIKKENNILKTNKIRIFLETNENGDFCYITGIEITKKTVQFEFSYTLSNKYINFHFVDLLNKKVSITSAYEGFYIDYSSGSCDKTLISLLFMENIYTNKMYLKMIIDALLLNKRITVEEEDLILLNCDIDLKPYRNDSAIINILENNFIEKKENIRSRFLV